MRVAACEAYGRLRPDDLSATVAPGIAPLLERLHARDDALLSLVTGNFEPIARMKLARSRHRRLVRARAGRLRLRPRVARRAAGDRSRARRRRRRARGRDARPSLVGDTPRDIACARADGVRVVAIATGPFGVAELREADAVARDGHELGAVLEPLLAGAGAGPGGANYP